MVGILNWQRPILLIAFNFPFYAHFRCPCFCGCCSGCLSELNSAAHFSSWARNFGSGMRIWPDLDRPTDIWPRPACLQPSRTQPGHFDCRVVRRDKLKERQENKILKTFLDNIKLGHNNPFVHTLVIACSCTYRQAALSPQYDLASSWVRWQVCRMHWRTALLQLNEKLLISGPFRKRILSSSHLGYNN